MVRILHTYQHSGDDTRLEHPPYQRDHLLVASIPMAVVLAVWRGSIRPDYLFTVAIHGQQLRRNRIDRHLLYGRVSQSHGCRQ